MSPELQLAAEQQRRRELASKSVLALPHSDAAASVQIALEQFEASVESVAAAQIPALREPARSAR